MKIMERKREGRGERDREREGEREINLVYIKKDDSPYLNHLDYTKWKLEPLDMFANILETFLKPTW